MNLQILIKIQAIIHSQVNQRYPPQQPQLFKPVQKTSTMGGVAEEYHKPISSNEQ